MVWTSNTDHAWGAFPTHIGIPQEVTADPNHEIRAGEGGRYLYRVCSTDDPGGKVLISENGKDPSSNFGMLYADEYPHLVSIDGDSVTPEVVAAVSKGFASDSPSKFIHASANPRSIWNKYGEKYRGMPRFEKLSLCRIDMDAVASEYGTLRDGCDFVDLSTPEKCSRWIDRNCSFIFANKGQVITRAGDDLRRAFNFATTDAEVLLSIAVPRTAMLKMSTAQYVDKSLSATPSRVKYLRCPFAEKDAVKRLGAKWDPDSKQWFVRYTDRSELTRFQRWW